MRPHKLTLALCGFMLAAIPLAFSSNLVLAGSDPEPLSIRPAHRAFLSRMARRTIQDSVAGAPVYDPAYTPAALELLSGEVIVRVRQRGYLLTHAGAGPDSLALATRHAALGAAKALKTDHTIDVTSINDLLIEIEVIGPSTPIDAKVDWTNPGSLDPYIELGVYGLGLRGQGLGYRLCPSEFITAGVPLSETLDRLAKRMGSTRSKAADVALTRFRTAHWYQPHDGADVVSLSRGLTILPPSIVSERNLDAAIHRVAAYMIYRQLDSGLFSYQFEPGRDAYSDENNMVRQIGATAALTTYARWSGRGAAQASADLSLRFHLKNLTPLKDVEEAAFVASADGVNKLGLTALLCLALAEHAEPDRYAKPRESLARAMLWLQRPSGMFLTAFPPILEVRSQDYFPGEALLALAGHYAHAPAAGILDAFDRAVTFYQDYFRSERSPAFVPWQVQAFAKMVQHTKRTDYRDFVFELCDWLAVSQRNEGNCRWPELWGGLVTARDGQAGASTAAYLAAFADALALARKVGDAQRVRRYEKVVAGASRFVMQLQVRPEEAYYMRSPRDAVGGIRATPSRNLLRIDHCQIALTGLIKARQVLFSN